MHTSSPTQAEHTSAQRKAAHISTQTQTAHTPTPEMTAHTSKTSTYTNSKDKHVDTTQKAPQTKAAHATTPYNNSTYTKVNTDIIRSHHSDTQLQLTPTLTQTINKILQGARPSVKLFGPIQIIAQFSVRCNFSSFLDKIPLNQLLD